jgi:molybdate transport system substrate-binding protein
MNVENGQALRDPRYNRVAMANPRLAPYGLAAAQVLDNLERQGITVALRVMGENITQAYQFTETGNVPVGFVALSQVIENGVIHRGAGWIVPAEMHDPIRQDAVLLNKGKENEAALAFLEFIEGEQAKTIINSYGYDPD